MYSVKPGFIIGFHGCDKSVRDSIVNGGAYKQSENSYDWLGHGFYIWEYNEKRALEFITEKGAKDPSVLGVIVSLGHCLDLLDSKYLELLRNSYDNMQNSFAGNNSPLPVNRAPKNSSENLIRNLDCAVIENLHAINPGRKYDSVRGVFTEGHPLYEGAGFNEKNHIQIAIINPNCIKAFFIPRELDDNWENV